MSDTRSSVGAHDILPLLPASLMNAIMVIGEEAERPTEDVPVSPQFEACL